MPRPPPALSATALLGPALLCLTLAPAVAADWPPGRLLAGLSGDWNGDGMPDLAVLVQGADDTADLLVYLGADRGMTEHVRVPGAAFSGPMYGQSPGLEARSATSFSVTSEQIGIGRTLWSQQITVAWRGGAFVVAGFTYGFADRIDNDHFGRCDLNLLTGAWERSGSPGEGHPERAERGRDGQRAFPVSELREGFFPDACTSITQ